VSLRDWFAAKQKHQNTMMAEAINDKLDDDELARLWTQCFSCQANLPTKSLEANDHVCPECGYHFRIGAHQRIAQLCDAGSFVELDAGMRPLDPLLFTDTDAYARRQQQAFKKTGLDEAIITGLATIGQQPLALGVMDFAFMGGSMGSVVGEKITRLIERAIIERYPVLLVCSSGGARMQEGIFSLMQMVKTGAALAKLHDAGLLYVTLLTEPTFGGVTASYGMLGDVIVAEAGARIGFAGRRVIEQTIRQKLPSDFQTADYLMQYGQVDMVLNRQALPQALTNLLCLHTRRLTTAS
jgi:acetyl-CoA carboxylase carboxyl transferase subunit beta